MDILQPNKTFQLSRKTVFSPGVDVLNGRWIFSYWFLSDLNPDIMSIKLRMMSCFHCQHLLII